MSFSHIFAPRCKCYTCCRSWRTTGTAQTPLCSPCRVHHRASFSRSLWAVIDLIGLIATRRSRNISSSSGLTWSLKGTTVAVPQRSGNPFEATCTADRFRSQCAGDLTGHNGDAADPRHSLAMEVWAFGNMVEERRLTATKDLLCVLYGLVVGTDTQQNPCIKIPL